MGKKKNRQGSVAAEDPKKLSKDTQAQKSYRFSANKTANPDANVVDDELFKVELPERLQAEIVELILSRRNKFSATCTVSKRITSKKLVDVYMCLAGAGFKRSQIEDAMNNTMQYGGDLIDALDWLCLNLTNDQLPEGFSQTFCKEESRTRQKFIETPPVPPEVVTSKQETSQKSNNAAQKSELSMKDWILQYAEDEDEDGEDEDGSSTDCTRNLSSENFDPNEQYLQLAAKILDAKNGALQAKQDKDNAAQKSFSNQIRQYSQEMDKLSKHPHFNPAVKIAEVNECKPPSSFSNLPYTPEDITMKTETTESAEDDFAGFAMFDEESAAKNAENDAVADTKKKNAQKSAELDKRSFAYTRQQWTGKSPKQFLIDWMRRHLAASPPPSFHKVCMPRQLYRSRVKIVRKDGNLEFCPDICCENVKEAEHLAATRALYDLCRGQSVHQLLPPPYRDVWLEWKDTEEKSTQAQQVERDKPRDLYVSRLMKKLKVTGETAAIETEAAAADKTDDVEESWEDLTGDEEAPAAVSVKSNRPLHQAQCSAAELRDILVRQQRSTTYQQMLESRSRLPVFQHQAAILDRVRRESVVLIAGATGSGKSTQIPQFILQEALSNGTACNVLCTQPRRISAISLASRVAEELAGPPPGASGALCGYQIRLESRVSAATRLRYVTTGVLLRRLQSDAEISDVTHVIVDEVHERSVQSDFLLIILRQLLTLRPDLKVILMSATLDAEKFSAYFQHCPVIEIPGRTFPVEVYHLEDVIQMTSYKLERDSRFAIREDRLVQENHARIAVTAERGETHHIDASWQKVDLYDVDISGLDCEKYSHHTRNVMSRLRTDKVNCDLIVELLHCIDERSNFHSLDGAILVFLPGLAHIQELYETLLADRAFSDKKRFRIVALHSVLSSNDQQMAFSVPPAGVRKIVIATNIAETGITIPDVVFVIDSGKVKETRYVESSQMSALEEVFISRASALQRQGRAGRVREGIAFRLYSQQKFDSLKAYTVPEIMRVPVEELCLHILKCDRGDPAQFLQLALDPPNSQTVARAMSILREVGACTYGTPTLTPLGHHLAALPVDVRVGKMLVFGAIFGCLDATCVIAAAIGEKSVFETRVDKRQDGSDESKCGLAIAQSDHITMLNAYLGWQHAKQQGSSSEIAYCRRRNLKRRTLMEIENISRDLKKIVMASGFADVPMETLLRTRATCRQNRVARGDVLKIGQSEMSSAPSAGPSPPLVAVLKAVLTAGLYPNVARVAAAAKETVAMETRQPCTAQTTQGIVQVHQSSVNRFFTGPGWLVYHEKMKLARVYLRDSTAISPIPILLFGGAISVQHKQRLVCVDDQHNFTAFAKTGVIFKEVRMLMDEILRDKLRSPCAETTDRQQADDVVVAAILDLIVSESESHRRR